MKARILYIGRQIGFAGGIERYAYQTSVLLRGAGYAVDYAGEFADRHEELFRQGFDNVMSSPDVPAAYDLAVLHKLCPVERLEKLRKLYGNRLVFIAHDHDLYCPRHHYYTPFGRKNCHRAFSPIRCRLCSMATHPANWAGALSQKTGALLERLSEHHAVVLSSFMRDNLQKNGFASEKIHIIPPFVESGSPRGDFCPDGRLRILFLGQLIRGKGVDLLLDALSRMKSEFDAVIAGDGKDRQMLETMAGNIKPSNIHFPGWIAEPEKCFENADVLAFPSRWQEPFGLSGIEAMAHGVPVAGFSVGGVGEWLVDGQTGFSVPEGDTAAFASALDRMAREPEMLAEMSRRCVEFTKEKFSPARFVENMGRLLEEVSR